MKRVVLILTLAVVAGMLYEKVSEKRDQERVPRVGRSVDIGGRSLNIYCSGEGSPSVILDTGGSAPGYSNLPLQALISKETRRYEPHSTFAPINRLPVGVRGLLCTAVPYAARVGLVRLLMSASGPGRLVPSGFTKSQAATLHALELQPKAIVASSGGSAWERSANEARAAGNLGDVPVIVLTAGKPLTGGDPRVDTEIAAFHEIWVHQLQRKLAALSTRGKQVIVDNSSHDIAGDMPTAAVGAIHQILSDIRGQ